jgi:transposase
VCAKRLEKGRFHWPEAEADARSVGLRQEELSALVAGLDLGQTQQRRGWWRAGQAS